MKKRGEIERVHFHCSLQEHECASHRCNLLNKKAVADFLSYGLYPLVQGENNTDFPV